MPEPVQLTLDEFNRSGVVRSGTEVYAFDPSRAALRAARRPGVARSRVYQLLASGALDDTGAQPQRITLGSVERRLTASPPVGAQMAPLGAWAVLALASGDAAFRAHVADLLSDPDRSRARSRLRRQGF